MVTIRTRSLAAIAAGALLLAPLAGCGGSSNKPAHANSTSSSSPTGGATPGDTSSNSGGGNVDAAKFVDDITSAMRAKQTAHMVIELGSSMTATADFRYAADGTPEMRMVAQTGGTKYEVILTGGAMYLQQPGGKYLKISKSDPALGSLLSQFSSLGPQESLKLMKSGIKKVTKVGTTQLDGSEVTKYELTVDAQAAAKQLGAAAASAAANLPKTVTYTLYVDNQNLMRGIDMDVAGQKIVMRVSGWGSPVNIAAPPASKLVKQ